MRLEAVEVSRLPVWWPRVERWLETACERPGCDLTANDLLAACIEEQAQLILIRDGDGPAVAAGVTQVREYESGKQSCWVLAIGGAGARAWRHTLGLIEAGALANGCDCVEFVGRPAWTALLPDYTAETHFLKDIRP